ncbi:MAG: hypothetical protein IKP21_04905 [Bacteroidales bacterium]|nr:hypothetical protein [Bacteroidales bacterium]
MKHISRLIFLLAAVLMLASCYKCPPEGDHVVAYTVDKGPEQRVYLVDNNEWQALLDRFCNYAEDGSEVTFYNANHKAAKSPTKEAVTYSTTDREAMKRWMAQMEDEGMTVTVTYDPNTGTYSGMAYAIAQQQGTCYTGQLVSVARDYYSDIPQYGYWALRINEDTVFRLAWNGSYHPTNTPLIISGAEYHMGDTVTLCGSTYAKYGYEYTEIIYILDLDNHNYEDDLWRPFLTLCSEGDPGGLMITIDENNHTIYSTSTNENLIWQGKIGGGIFRYEETSQTDNLGNPIYMVYNDATQSGGNPFSIEQRPNGYMILHDLTSSSGSSSSIWLYRRYIGWETWVCDTLGFNIVIHIDVGGDLPYHQGYSSYPFYVDCTTPFEAGSFVNNNYGYWGPLTYTETGREVNSTYEEIDYKTIRMTPVGEPDGCIDSYVFHLIERTRE